MAHLRGIPDALRERYGIPIAFYDGDVPMSLPEYGGMDTGFNPYHGADPWEYDLVLSNSEGGIPRLLELGARRADALYWGADPEFFAPQPVDKDVDVFFYGYGDKFRRDWMKTMVGEPSRLAPELDFALGGLDFQGDTGTARALGDVPFNVFARAISVRVNLNSAASRTPRCRPPRRAGSSSSPRPGQRSCPTRTRESSAGSSRDATSSSDAGEPSSHRELSPIPQPRRWDNAHRRVFDEHMRTPRVTAARAHGPEPGARRRAVRRRRSGVERGGRSAVADRSAYDADASWSNVRRATRRRTSRHGARASAPFNAARGAVQTGFRHVRDEGYLSRSGSTRRPARRLRARKLLAIEAETAVS
jgi:hypothetical protein